MASVVVFTTNTVAPFVPTKSCLPFADTATTNGLEPSGMAIVAVCTPVVTLMTPTLALP